MGQGIHADLPILERLNSQCYRAQFLLLPIESSNHILDKMYCLFRKKRLSTLRAHKCRNVVEDKVIAMTRYHVTGFTLFK